jgi:Cu(I)-responsive transcriptional regulator
MKTPANLKIGAAARASGISAKMLRHYEGIGLLPPAPRSDGGYRLYSANDVRTLEFVRRARALGFSIVEIKRLLGLWRNKSRASAEVKALAAKHIRDLDAKILELGQMRDALRDLSQRCHGDRRPDCPILEGLAKQRLSKT